MPGGGLRDRAHIADTPIRIARAQRPIERFVAWRRMGAVADSGIGLALTLESLLL